MINNISGRVGEFFISGVPVGEIGSMNVPASSLQIETTLHVVNLVAVGFKCRALAKLDWPCVGIAGMNNVPANTSFAHTTL